MERTIAGLIGFVVLLGIGFGLTQMRKGDAADKLLLEAKAFVAHADLYHQHQEIFDWLVTTAHEEVVGDSISTTYGGRRRRSKIEINYDKYQQDLITRMLELAKGNSYYEVHDSLERLVDPDAAARQKAEKEAKKKKKSKK